MQNALATAATDEQSQSQQGTPEAPEVAVVEERDDVEKATETDKQDQTKVDKPPALEKQDTVPTAVSRNAGLLPGLVPPKPIQSATQQGAVTQVTQTIPRPMSSLVTSSAKPNQTFLSFPKYLQCKPQLCSQDCSSNNFCNSSRSCSKPMFRILQQAT